MVDLETLSTSSNALILSIGAAKFDPLGAEVTDTFHTAIDLDQLPANAYGFDISPSTVKWWLAEDKTAARAALAEASKTDLHSALYGFADWFGPESLPVWGNGATFDNVILRNAFTKLMGAESAPWKFWHDRCYRTIKNLAPGLDYEHTGVAHSAVGDAISQALHLQKVIKHLGLEVVG
jgi:exodeoxyribonuclease VIII